MGIVYHASCDNPRAHILVDVASDRLCAELLDLLARAVHRAFASGACEWTADELVSWIYRDLFAMPPEDPALGLDGPDPFSTISA